MAFLEGQTVKDKIAQRPLKLEEVLDIAIHSAQGLQAAHEKGIVHRDIKPANVMVTPQDKVKIMDFGVALLANCTRVTRTATILGTPAYMSPEQTQGQATDRRTDIWSLGVIIYEMVTGRLPFGGERQEAVLHAIVSEEPEPITALRAGLPMQLEWIVSKALAKNADDRYQHVDELIVDLRGLLRNSTKSTIGAHTAAAPQQRALQISPQEERVLRRKVRLYQSALTVTAAALFILAVFHFREALPQGPLRRFGLVPPVAVGNIGLFAHVAISPNGRYVAFAEASAQGRLWVHDLDRGQARAIEATEGAFAPFWSPDSSFIGFAANEELKTVSVQAGLPKRVCRLRTRICEGASWSADSKTIVFTSGTPGVLWEVPAQGGTPQLLIRMQALAQIARRAALSA